MSSLLFRSLSIALACLTLAPLSGCDDVDAADDEDASFRGGTGCAKCQFNSPDINGFPISSLDLSGGENDAGVRLRALRDPDGGTYILGVLGEELAAYDEQGLLRAHGAELIKWELLLDVAGAPQTLQIVERTELSSWAQSAPPLAIYGIVGSFDGEPLRNVCPGQPLGTSALTILHGDTYDAEHKRVDQTGDQWITLACVDEAAFKLKRLGYGPRGTQGPDGKHPTLAQRNATLKMLTADYCGTGQSFTQFHTKLYWQNEFENVLQTLFLTPDKLFREALWDEHGALCLDRPRSATLKQVALACKLPTCTTAHAKLPHVWQSYAPGSTITTFAPAKPKK